MRLFILSLFAAIAFCNAQQQACLNFNCLEISRCTFGRIKRAFADAISTPTSNCPNRWTWQKEFKALTGKNKVNNAAKTEVVNMCKSRGSCEENNDETETIEDCLVVKSFVQYQNREETSSVKPTCSCIGENGAPLDIADLADEECSGLESTLSMLKSSIGFSFNTVTQTVSVPAGAILSSTTIEEEEPDTPKCTDCTDNPTTGMIRKNKTCDMFPSTLSNKCNKHSTWREKKFCQLSCYNAGNGYSGDVCCRRRRRRLETSGDKKVLIVRADSDNSSTTSDESTLKEEILGITGTDVVNGASQYSACSYGKLTLSLSSMGNAGSHSVSITNTVIGSGHAAIRNAMFDKATSDLGDLSAAVSAGTLDLVIFCIPPGTVGNWIAYAYVNWFVSVYNDDWCEYPTSIMHELGHNFGLAHSGEDANEYNDQSGVMGFSYADDDGPLMCFNGAKTYQFGWFPEFSQHVESADPFQWLGHLIGFNNKNEAGLCEEGDENCDTMIFRLTSQTGDEYYVHFNRKDGFNSGTKEGGDQVMVATTERGLGYRQSWLQAKMGQNSQYTIANFGDHGDLIIDVGDIARNTGAKSWADVTIRYGGIDEDVSEVPTPVLSSEPTISQSPTSIPSGSPTDSKGPSLPPSSEPTISRSPTSKPTSSPVDSEEPTPFGSTEPTISQSPTLIPTSSPTGSQQPTSLPSSEPTNSRSPTSKPTSSPVDSEEPTPFGSTEPTISQSPTSTPTSSPTGSQQPTALPSSEPTTSRSPTAKPTSSPIDSEEPTPSVSSEPTISQSPTSIPTSSPTGSQQPTTSPSSEPTISRSPTPEPTDPPIESSPTDPPSTLSGITITFDGEEQVIPLSGQQSYDANQDEYLKRPLILSDGGHTVTVNGNMYRAVPLPTPFIPGYATTLEFDFTLGDLEEVHAICIDEDLIETGSRCFVLAGTQSLSSSWERVMPQATVGETIHYSISLAKFWKVNENLRWLVFMQDNDSSNRDTGSTTYANISIINNHEYDNVTIVIDGEDVGIPLDSQVSYDQGQDEYMKRPLIVTDDARTVTLKGNMYRALPFPDQLSFGAMSTLEVGFTLTDIEEAEAMCIEDDLHATSQHCFIFSGTQDYSSSWTKLEPQATVNETRHYSIPLGRFWGESKWRYLTFFQDNDSSNRDTGECSFSNIEIKHGPEFYIEDDGGKITTNSAGQQSYIENQDSTKNNLNIFDDGASIQLKGNTWRSLPLNQSITIDRSTNIDFDFTLAEERDIHAICFTVDGAWENHNTKCLVGAGTQHFGSYNLQPRPQVDETRHYSIPVGLLFQGTFNYLSIFIDNDTGDRYTGGASTWSNIKLSQVEPPQLSIKVNGATVDMDSSTVAAADISHDTNMHFLEFPDSTSVTLKGNNYKSINFTEPITINHATDLDFDFTLVAEREHHSICVVTSTDRRRFWHRYYCFSAAGTNGWGNDVDLTPKTQAGQTRHYHYPIGRKVPEGLAYYLVFIQDNDGSDRTTGECTFSNIEFSQRPGLKLKIDGVDTSLFNQQFSYGQHQDTTDNMVVVTDSDDKISMSGNLWKAFKFDTPLTITDNTILSFNLEVEEHPEIMAICFDEDLTDSNNDSRCIKFAGDQTSNLGTIIYRGIKQTDITEVNSYHIKLSEYFSGDMNYIAFIHDQDKGDKTAGKSHITDLQLFEQQASCLSDKSFNFAFSECTAENFVSQVGSKMSGIGGCSDRNAWSELMALFEVNSDAEVREKIAQICKSAYAEKGVNFNKVMSHEKQFVNEFFDGGNIWNYEVDESGEADLGRDAARIGVISNKFSKSNIGFPDVHNFEGCKLRAAMCCYPAKRSGGSRVDANDNSNACYMDFSKARQSSHVRDGYSIYSGAGNEGALHCHGFAWGNDYGFHGNAFKGNTLFEVAMVKGLMNNGHVGHLPGAPMCGCVENMPVVTRADCTKTTVSQTVYIKYDPTDQFVAEVNIQNINHSNCGDLSGYYAGLVANGEASANEMAQLDKHLVGDCTPALTDFLATKGFAFS